MDIRETVAQMATQDARMSFLPAIYKLAERPAEDQEEDPYATPRPMGEGADDDFDHEAWVDAAVNTASPAVYRRVKAKPGQRKKAPSYAKAAKQRFAKVYDKDPEGVEGGHPWAMKFEDEAWGQEREARASTRQRGSSRHMHGKGRGDGEVSDDSDRRRTRTSGMPDNRRTHRSLDSGQVSGEAAPDSAEVPSMPVLRRQRTSRRKRQRQVKPGTEDIDNDTSLDEAYI